MTSIFSPILSLRLRLRPSEFLYPGINYPWNAYGADFGTGGFGDLNDLTQFTSHMTALAAQRVKVVRWWLMADGRHTPVFDGSGAVTGLNTDFLVDLDAVLALATTLDIKYVMTLVDNFMFKIPATFSGSVQEGGHDDIVKNSTRRQLYLDLALKPILEHVAASPHADRVLMWDICNEPEGQMAGGYNGFDFYTNNAQIALSDMQDFVRLSAQYIHTYGGVHAKATVGAAIPVWCPLWIGLGLDFHQGHYYDFMDDLTGVPGSGITPVWEITRFEDGTHLDAPCILGEFPTGGLTSYGLSDTAVKSARWYLDTIRSRGYIGSLGWSLTAGDSASDWTSFAPVFTDWMNDNYPAAASVAFQTGASQGGGGPYTIALTVASAVGQERLVALSGIANGTAATVTFSGVTIDGQAATQVGSYARGTGTGSVLSLWRAPGTSGTSINVTATASAAMFDLRCLLWTLSNVGTLFATSSIGLATTTTTQSLSLNTPANGVVIAAAFAFDSGSAAATWTGLTERFDGLALYGSDAMSGADAATASASTPLAISVTWGFGGSFNVAGIAASFNPS